MRKTAAAAAAAAALWHSCEGCQLTPFAWGVLCGVRVGRSHAPEPRARSLFSLTARVCSKTKTAHRAPASACCSSPQNTWRCNRCCICTPPRLRRITIPACGGLALAWPRRTGHAFGDARVVAWCGANHLPCDARTNICEVDYAGFLLMRCVHSSGTTRGLLANKITVPLQTQKTKPNPKML